MKNFINFLSLTLLLLLFSCNKDEQQPAIIGSISGTITTKDAPTVPVEGMQMKLYDLSAFPADSTLLMLDSVLTDAVGSYYFGNLPEGSYAVIPDYRSENRFEPANPADTGIITINRDKQHYQIDLLMSEPSNDHGLCMVFTITNHLPQNWWPRYNYVFEFYRLIWICGFPTWMENTYLSINYWEDSGYKEHYYGYMAPGWAVWNTWNVEFRLCGGEPIFETDLSWLLPFTPQVAYFDVDMVNHTCTWTHDGTWDELFGTNGAKDHPSVIVRQANPKD